MTKHSKPWVEGREISRRPPEAADRAVPGHWEGDLVVGGDMASCLITLVERRSRFLLMSRLTVHDADTVEERLVKMAGSIPGELKRTLTWDQGAEMANVADFELSTPFKVYFCDPCSPWERLPSDHLELLGGKLRHGEAALDEQLRQNVAGRAFGKAGHPL